MAKSKSSKQPPAPLGMGGGIDVKKTVMPTTNPGRDKFNVRDSMATLIGNGYKAFSDDQSKGEYAGLKTLLGPQMAQKLMTHIFLFNNRSDIQNKTPEERLQLFYKMGAMDPSVNELIGRMRSLDYGPIVGFRNSPDVGSKQLTGRWALANPDTLGPAGSAVTENISKSF